MSQLHTTKQYMVTYGKVKEWLERHDIENTTKVKQPALASLARWLQN